MATFAAADVVTVPFPVSVDRAFKVRPALVLAPVVFGRTTDYILCAITSQLAPDPSILVIRTEDVLDGSPNRTSYIRPTYLFTVHGSLILERIGRVRTDLLERAGRDMARNAPRQLTR